MSNGRESSLLTADIKLCLGLIDRMLGGGGNSLDRVRPLTVVEESLMENVTDQVLKLISATWAKLQDFPSK